MLVQCPGTEVEVTAASGHDGPVSTFFNREGVLFIQGVWALSDRDNDLCPCASHRSIPFPATEAPQTLGKESDTSQAALSWSVIYVLLIISHSSEISFLFRNTTLHYWARFREEAQQDSHVATIPPYFKIMVLLLYNSFKVGGSDGLNTFKEEGMQRQWRQRWIMTGKRVDFQNGLHSRKNYSGGMKSGSSKLDRTEAAAFRGLTWKYA